MSDAFYNALWYAGLPAFWTSSRPTVLGAEHARRDGAFLLASNHQAPYDIPLLMRHCARNIDFVSITEVFENPLVARIYGGMNAFPLDRSRPDAPTVRTILDRLRRGRVVGIFPEGRMRRGSDSVLVTRRIRPGVGRIAKFAGVPIVPVVVVGSPLYGRFTSWLPLRRTRYGVAFGSAVPPDDDAAGVEARMIESMVALHADLTAAMASR